MSTTCCSSANWRAAAAGSSSSSTRFIRRNRSSPRARPITASTSPSPATSGSSSRSRILYPLAGLPARDAATYLRLQEAMEALAGARFTIARDLLEGRITREQAVALAQRYQLVSRGPRRAVGRLHRAVSRLCDQLRPRRGLGADLCGIDARPGVDDDGRDPLRADAAERPGRSLTRSSSSEGRHPSGHRVPKAAWTAAFAGVTGMRLG